MYNDGSHGKASGSQGKPYDGLAAQQEGDAAEGHVDKYATVLYRPTNNMLFAPQPEADGSIPVAPLWQSPSRDSAGAIRPLENVKESYARAGSTSQYYGSLQSYQPLLSQATIKDTPGPTVDAGGPQQGAMGNLQDISEISQMGYGILNNSADVSDMYGALPMGIDRGITIGDIVKLTEAINELNKRMPLPPTPELLSALEPHLSMTLQLTYLRAYIQNQQLLLDLKNEIFGRLLNGYDFKNSARATIPTLCPPPPVDSQQYPETYYGDLDASQMAVDSTADACWPQPTAPAAMPINCSNPPALEYSIGENTRAVMQQHAAAPQGDVYGSDAMALYPSYEDALDAINQQQQELDAIKLRALPQNSDDPAMSTEVTPRALQQTTLGSANDAPVSGSREPISTTVDSPPQLEQDEGTADQTPDTALKNEVPTIPSEHKNMVKYDGQKHAFVSVYLGPLGARRRRLFSIRKFGMEEALKLATDFAAGSTSVVVSRKERRLLEEVCEVALRHNPASGSRLEHVEAARAMPETRGLVFSCGAQLWMIITYNSSDGDRAIEVFSVEEYGFEGAYKAAVEALHERLQNSDTMTSKLSGPLYFWLERRGASLMLCLMVTPRDLMRQGTDYQELHIGRFDLATSGGFNGARKLAQSVLRARPPAGLVLDGPAAQDALVRLRLVLLEVFRELLRELLDLRVVVRGAPAQPLVEHLGRHALDRDRHHQAEDGHRLAPHVLERAAVDRVDDGARVPQRNAPALLRVDGALDPAGVEQPDVRLVLEQLLLQQLRVDHGVHRQEGLRVAGREGGRGPRDAHLRADHLAGVAAHEVVHGLLRGELADGRNDAEGVAGEEDDVGGVHVDLGGDHHVRDVLQRVRAAGVLRDGAVGVVDLVRHRVVDDVFDHRAELDGVEDLRLLLTAEVLALGVAAALDVEDALVRPHVLVVADELARRVRRQRRLAGAGEPEEQRHVAARADVARRVQRQQALERHQVHHEREDALFHLARILRPQNHHLHPLVAQADGRRARNALGVAVAREGARVVEHEVRLEGAQLLRGRLDQQVLHKERVVRARADDPHADAVLRVPSGVGVGDVDALLQVDVVDGALAVDGVRGLRQLDVHLSPPNVGLGHILCHGPLVGWRAPRLLAGLAAQRARRVQHCVRFVQQRVMRQDRRAGVQKDRRHLDSVPGDLLGALGVENVLRE
ncbi:uncharacterized protein BcabD6B2_34050 [Babesia caballi]|uniref:AP2/ERF domain-containing protein n=1 Tax=Babesia caballi TaxID=5871 RepID=A0AAV4LVS8_BABCB|nr:hypothetical protein BcabD6B2_34050 [Babesia caballi]